MINNNEIKLGMSSGISKRRCSLRSCRERIGMRQKMWFEGLRLSFFSYLNFIYLWCTFLTWIGYYEMQLGMSHNNLLNYFKYIFVTE